MVVAVLAGCGGSSKASASTQTAQKDAALYQIDQIEQTWHKAASTHNVNLMMTLWAPGAVFNIGTETLTGKAQIRHFFATENKAFMPQKPLGVRHTVVQDQDRRSTATRGLSTSSAITSTSRRGRW